MIFVLTFFDHTINFVSKTNDFPNLFFSLSEELICSVHFLHASHSLLDMGRVLFRRVIVNASCELSFIIQTIATYWVPHFGNYMFYMVKLRFRIKGYLKIQRKEISINDTVKYLCTTNWGPVYMEMGDPR